jgi:P4 family phage/plasmid primase-like protien
MTSDYLTTHLYPHHRHELDASTIHPDVIAERGYRTITRPTANDQAPRRELESLGFPKFATEEDRYFPGRLTPIWGANGRVVSYEWKPNVAVRTADGKTMKYVGVKNRPTDLDVHPRWTRDRGADDPVLLPYIKDVTKPLWITEGIKKADALTSRDVVTVALAGVWNWRGSTGTHGAWEDIALKGREITICFDADTVEKPQIQQAMKRLGRFLKSRGAARVWYLVVPGETRGTAVKGVDDYLHAGGTLDELIEHRTGACPEPQKGINEFTEVRLAELCAAEVMEGHFLCTAALGWLHQTGTHWAPVDDPIVTEAVRQWVLSKYLDAVETHKERVAAGQTVAASSPEMDGWATVQSRTKVSNITALARGIEGVWRDAADFDTDPDILNTPTGVINLRTGEQTPYDPSMLITKITAVGYNPAATSMDWKAALSALPDDTHDWFQTVLGEAITGHASERLVLLTGGGDNGKTALLGSIFRTLNTYAAKVPNTLLLKTRQTGGATPERMTLRGIRLAYMEETPENGYLDTQIAKDLLDAQEIEGRHLYKDIVSWKPTHSMFLNTNHVPTVTDTDHGTWRRLLRISFPYKFKQHGEALDTANDRVGDPTLKRRLTTKAVQEAILAWLVHGARLYYGGGASLRGMPNPPSVDAAIWSWRQDCDVILRFLNERLDVDPGYYVIASELYQEFRTWRSDSGKPLGDAEFKKRITGHSALPDYVYADRIQAKTLPAGLSRPAWRAASPPPAKPSVIRGLRFTDSLVPAGPDNDADDQPKPEPDVPTLLDAPGGADPGSPPEQPKPGANQAHQAVGNFSSSTRGTEKSSQLLGSPGSHQENHANQGVGNLDEVCPRCSWPTNTYAHYQCRRSEEGNA